MQLATLVKWLAGVTNYPINGALRKILLPVYDRMTSVTLTSAGLVIKGAASALAKTGGSVTYFISYGVLGKIAASTDMPALAGTVTNAQFGVYCFFVDSGGTTSMAFGGSFASLAAVKFPQFPVGKALIGFVIVNPTGTGDFVGGTTALDDGTVVPNAVFVSPTEGFDSWCLIGPPGTVV